MVLAVAEIDYGSMSPNDLRKEADRRDLVERARGLAERHEARRQLIEALHSIDRRLVRSACADGTMKSAVERIVAAEKAETPVTNGDVHMAGFGAPDNWWRDATADHPKQRHDGSDLLDEIERGRKSAWPGFR